MDLLTATPCSSAVKEITGGKVSLTTGTLYGTLDRLVDEGLIQRAGSEIVRGRARQYFEITDKGSAQCSSKPNGSLKRPRRSRRR